MGCPGAEVIAAIASRRMPLSQAEPYLDHLTSCSPCYRDFSQQREAHRLRRMRTMFGVAASVLIVAAIATWAVVRRQNNEQVAGIVVIDLRNRSVTRGTEPLPIEPPVEIARTDSHLSIYLPLGSDEGAYSVRILTSTGEPVVTGSGVASLRGGITLLPVNLTLSSASPGPYVLQLRRFDSEWNSFSVRIR